MSIYSVQLINFLLAQLSPREREVKRLIAQGYANKAIAAELTISQRTVEAHRYNIFRKLGVRNAVELVNVLSTSSTQAPLVAEPIQQSVDVEPEGNIHCAAGNDTGSLEGAALEKEKSANEADSEESPD